MRAIIARVFGGVCVLVGAGAGLAHATPIAIPDATYFNVVHVTERNGLTHDQSTHLATGGLRINGETTGLPFQVVWDGTTSNDYNVPSVAAAERALNTDLVSSESQLEYDVEFAGAPGSVAVRVQAGGEATAAEIEQSTAVAGDNQATAFVDMFPESDPFSRVFTEVASSDAASNVGTHLFSLDQTFTLQANTLYHILMYATAQATASFHAEAFVDPFFSVPTGYSVLTSAGIGNSLAATPIPGALPLFGSGLCALGFFGRRRQKAARAA